MERFEGAIIVVALFVIALLFASLLMSGCSMTPPRSEIYCIHNGDWVTCPKDVNPGTNLDRRE